MVAERDDTGRRVRQARSMNILGMSNELVDAWHLIAPPRDGTHGPLPPALVLLTVVTGLVDAFSYLRLGHVFVANMTGNVVFLPFALGGAAGFVWWTSILAIAAFSLGALAGGRIARTAGPHRGRHLLAATATQTAIVAAALVVALVAPSPYPTPTTVVLIALLATGMGLQNATARALAVPDLTTTVLTLTITGISADSTPAGGPGSRIGRRLVSIASMFLGALIGTLLTKSGHALWALLAAAALLAATTALAATAARSTAPWTTRP
jgi:uncharacterized membrane protein YoaK (UPF0700 family)